MTMIFYCLSFILLTCHKSNATAGLIIEGGVIINSYNMRVYTEGWMSKGSNCIQ